MIIFRYLCKEVIITLFAILSILMIVFITNEFIHYLNNAARGEITISAIMEMMALQVPMLLGYLLPLGLFLGILLTFGRLYADHEMVALSSCGFSNAQLIKITLFLACFLMIFSACLMFMVEPKMRWYRGKIIDEIETSATLQRILPGQFQVFDEQGHVFYAEKVNEKQNHLENVFLATQLNKPSPMIAPKWDLVMADTAYEKIFQHLRYLVFENGYRYIGTPGQRNFQITQFKNYWFRLNPNNHDSTLRYDALSTSSLWKMMPTDLHATAEIEWRFVMTFSVIAFALIGIPLSYVNPRKGKFGQIMPAILLYVIFANFMFAGRSWIEKGMINPALGLWWILAALFLIAAALFMIQIGWRRLFKLLGIPYASH